ncbi:hypothetical protein ACFYQ5_34495 [Streptomyces sp. NPDC005794]
MTGLRVPRLQDKAVVVTGAARGQGPARGRSRTNGASVLPRMQRQGK